MTGYRQLPQLIEDCLPATPPRLRMLLSDTHVTNRLLLPPRRNRSTAEGPCRQPDSQAAFRLGTKIRTTSSNLKSIIDDEEGVRIKHELLIIAKFSG